MVKCTWVISTTIEVNETIDELASNPKRLDLCYELEDIIYMYM